MKPEQKLNKAEQAGKADVRTLAQLLALPVDELDSCIKVAILRRLPDEALKRIAQAEDEQEAAQLYLYYGG